MKYSYLFILITIILMVAQNSCSQSNDDNRGYIVKVGDMAPDFSTQLNNGSTFKLSDYKGKTVMLQFTASWCGVCRKEMPFIENEIWKILKDKNFVLIGIDRDEPLETMNKFSKETGISYPLALDTGARIFSLYANPEAGVTRNVIINKEGKIVFLTRLFNQSEFDEMKKVIFGLVK